MYSVDELRLAFALHVARLIVDADDFVDRSEVEFLQEMFPPAELLACGFLDGDGRPTARFDEARRQALDVLPARLELEQKLQLVTLFVHACLADGQLHPRETAVMAQAAQALGIPDDAFAGRVRDTLAEGIEPPVLIAPARSSAGHRVSQAALCDALDPVDADGLAVRRRVLTELRDPSGRLVVAPSAEELSDGDVSGLRALVELLHREGLSLSAVGRLGLDASGEGAREWLAWAQRSWPWLGAWCGASHGGVDLVLALAPAQQGAPVRTQEALSAAVWVANWGVAYARRLGDDREDHARALLRAFGVPDLPGGFFDGSEALIDRLDARGTLVR